MSNFATALQAFFALKLHQKSFNFDADLFQICLLSSIHTNTSMSYMKRKFRIMTADLHLKLVWDYNNLAGECNIQGERTLKLFGPSFQL